MADDNALAPPPGFTLVDEGQGQPASATAQPTQPASDELTPPPGFTLVPEPNVQTRTAAPRDEGPGFLDRTYETSGAKGIVDLTVASAKRPISLYHQAIDAANKGDWRTASATAFKLINILQSNVGVDSDHPLVQAAKEIIMHPVHEIEAQYEENRKAGMGKVGAAVATVAAPNPAETLARLKDDYSKGNISGIVGDIAGAANSHQAGMLPLLGPAIQQVAGNLDTDLHAHHYGAVAGDILGPLLTMGFGKILGRVGEAFEAAEAGSIVSKEGEIAGVKVPVSAPQLKQPVNPTAGRVSQGTTSMVRGMGTAEGAQDFIDTRIQPRAAAATTQNLAQSAMRTIDDFRATQGQPPISAHPPMIRNVDGVVDALRSEAKGTYQKLDQAVEPEIQQWEADKTAWERDNPKPGSQAISPSTKTAATPGEKAAWQAQKDAWESANTKPKTFTELQDQITDAKRTLDAHGASQVVKEAAVKNLPKYEQDMQDYLNKYNHVVEPDELQGANRLWAQSYQYEWLANRLRSAGRGTTGTASALKQRPVQLNLSSLESIPGSFDNRFGSGAFARTLGSEGVSNYNDVLNALRNPVTNGMPLAQFLKGHVIGSLAKVPTGYIVDNLLFNPEFGQKMLQLWRNVGTVTKNTGTAVKAAPVIGPAVSKKSAKDVYAATAGSLGGKQ